MNLEFRRATEGELEDALLILKNAAINLQSKGIKQWEYWINPSEEKIDWIKEGFSRNEFYFIVLSAKIIGMFRCSDADLLYWGNESEQAKYIHSLVINAEFAGNGYGIKVIDILAQNAIEEAVYLLRLDCNSNNMRLCNYYENQGFIKVRGKQMPDGLMVLYEMRLK